MKRVLIFLLFFVVLVELFGGVSAAKTCGDVDTTGYSSGCVEINSCRDITGANTYYLLTNNVSSEGTCFRIINSNVGLDLNGYTVTYANRTIEDVVPNMGFELGSGDVPSNWDLSAAPSAGRTGTFVDGVGSWVPSETQSYVLEFNSPTSEQYVYSDLITLNANPGQQYILSDLAYKPGSYRTSVVGTVLDSSGTPLCTTTDGGYDGLTHWSADWCFFNVPADQQIRIRLGVTGGLGGGDAYFDGVEVKPSGNFAGYSKGWDRESHGILVDSNRNYARVTNGNIVQGGGKVYATVGVAILGGYSEIDNLSIEAYGPDSTGIYTSTQGTNIHHNTINLLGKRTHESHSALSAGIDIAKSSNGQVHHNNILRTQGMGVMAMYDPGENMDIYNNNIDIESSAIHCYAINLVHHSRIFNNFVNTTQGGGMASDNAINTTVFNNTVIIRDGPQEERGWLSKVFWTRYESGGHRIFNNTFIGYAGNNIPRPGERSRMTTVRIGGSVEDNGPTYFYDNYVEANTDEHSADTWAVALDLTTDSGTGHTIYIYNNTFKSNDYIVQFAGNDLGYGYAPSINNILSNNTLVKSGDALPEFRSVVAGSGYYGGVGGIHNCSLTDTRGVGGADVHDILFVGGSYLNDLDISWTLNVDVKDNGLSVLPGSASISIEDAYESLISSGASGANGRYSDTLIEWDIEGTGSSPVITDYSPYNVTVTYNGETQSQVVDLTDTTTLTFNFNTGPSRDVNSDGNINVIDLAIETFWQGKNSGESDWGFFSHLDLDEDGDIDWQDVLQIVGVI